MADLTPYPIGGLARRMFRELESRESIFDLPARRFFGGHDRLDLSIRFHHRIASSPLGPAAGPHTQMAQNLVLSWLGGGRILELKTVQVDDELVIPRPCIDMRTVGLNAEWSQELKLEESLEEYVKGSMLIELLAASGKVDLEPGFRRTLYDLSVGYDLRGIQSERVSRFVSGMTGARESVERLRRQLPAELGPLKDLDFSNRLSHSVTLSTFHGCPPREIRAMCEFLMREHELDCVIKFNPMLLGPDETRGLLHDLLGYHDLSVPDSAFERDTTWEQAVEIVEELEEEAAALGRSLGVKFSNTLIVKNRGDFLPDTAPEVYLSGPPLHVLAMRLVERFRARFGDRLPISFSAGIDRGNFADAVALGLVPITVCTDLLKQGGFGRLRGYSEELARRMEAARAASLESFCLTAYGHQAQALEEAGLPRPDPRFTPLLEDLAQGRDPAERAEPELWDRWLGRARLLNTATYLRQVLEDTRYSKESNDRPPRKIGSHLELFDCISCDLCLPACPNDANFTYRLAEQELPIVKARRRGASWRWDREGALRLEERHQIGNFADFCNDCGNCDVFCPEDGGPYLIKPRFFRREADWRAAPGLDGFVVTREGGRDRILGRIDGAELRLEVDGEELHYSGADFRISFRRGRPHDTLTGEGPDEIDLTYCLILDALLRAMLDPSQVNYVNSLYPGEGGAH